MDMRRGCVVCILNQMLRVADHLHLDETASDDLFKAALAAMSEHSFQATTSPQYAEKIYDRIAQLTRRTDPYQELKREQNAWVFAQSERIESLIASADDPLRICAELSLLGNIIDYGGVQIFDPGSIFAEREHMHLALDDYDELSRQLAKAGSLLMIGDNAGEAVFDRFWLRELKRVYPGLRLIYAVRQKPAINDMTLTDAQEIGMDEVAELIDSGSTFAGTIPALSSEPFKRIFYEADVVVAKGQGNYETLENCDRAVFFIFKVKCEVVANYARLPLGSLVLASHETLQAKRSFVFSRQAGV